MRGPALRAFSVCPICCSVHDAGTGCATCAGPSEAPVRERALPELPARRRGRAQAYVIGLGLGFAAFLSVMLLGLMIS
jgi:hypothetical protein